MDEWNQFDDDWDAIQEMTLHMFGVEAYSATRGPLSEEFLARGWALSGKMVGTCRAIEQGGVFAGGLLATGLAEVASIRGQRMLRLRLREFLAGG